MSLHTLNATWSSLGALPDALAGLPAKRRPSVAVIDGEHHECILVYYPGRRASGRHTKSAGKATVLFRGRHVRLPVSHVVGVLH